MSDQPICGFRLATELLCFDDQLGSGIFCVAHLDATCTACGQKAERECPTFVGEVRCGAPLCTGCDHKQAGLHGPVVAQAELVRQGLMGAVEVELKDLVRQGLISVTEHNLPAVSSRLVGALSMHVALQVLSALASGKDGLL